MDKPLQSIQDTLRLPFYQEESGRRGYDSSARFGQYIQNLVPEFFIDQTTQSKTQQLSKRQGIKQLGTTDYLTGIVNSPANTTLIDCISITAVYDVVVVSVFDSSNATIYIIQVRPQAGTAVKIGSFTSTPACTANDYCFVSEITTVSAGNSVPGVSVSYTNSVLGLGKAYYATCGTGVFIASSLTQITDLNYPSNQTPALIPIGRLLNVYSTHYIVTLDGRIWNSYDGQNDITKWSNATAQVGSVGVNAYPDQCIGLERYKNYIVAFGRNSIEFFSIIGSSATNASPLLATQQAVIKFGCKSPRMIKNVNDRLYWYSYGDSGSMGLWELTGFTPVKVSNAFIETSAISSWGANDLTIQNLQAALINQKPHIIISGINTTSLNTGYTGIPAGSDTFPVNSNDLLGSQLACYNIEDKTWWFMTCQGASGPYPSFITEFTSPTSSGNYSQVVLVTGQTAVYNLRTDGVYSDDLVGSTSKPVVTIAQLAPQWFGNEKRKRISKVKVIMNYPNQSATDLSVYSMYMTYIRENVQSYTGTFQPTNIQVMGINIPNSQYRQYFNNLGMGRLWAFSLIEKTKLNIVYKELEFDIQQGSH